MRLQATLDLPHIPWSRSSSVQARIAKAPANHEPCATKIGGAAVLGSPANLRRLLETIATEDFGLARLIQSVQCVHHAVNSQADLSAFFEDVLSEWERRGMPSEWAEVWDQVARGEVRGRFGTRGHVRRAGHLGTTLPETLTTVVDEYSWQRWQLSADVEAIADAGLSLPDFPVGSDPGRCAKLQSLLDTGRQWAQPSTPEEGAWLGRPSSHNGNCWVSTAQIHDNEPSEIVGSDTAEKVALRGLVSDPSAAYLLFSLDPSKLGEATDLLAAAGRRPGFADLGQVWFRAHSAGPAADRHRKHQWGSTVHLERSADPGSDDTGLPERVIAAVPVASNAIARIEVLPASSDSSRSMSTISKADFVAKLKSGQEAADIVNTLLTLLNAGGPPAGVS